MLIDPKGSPVRPALEETGGGTARFLHQAPEEIEVKADAGPDGAPPGSSSRRTSSSLADLDGRPVPVLTANAHHIGVRVPAGSHKIRFWIDRRPLHRALWGALAGLIGIVGLGWWGSRPSVRTPAKIPGLP